MALTLTSSSTLAEIKAAYDDNCAYDLNESTTECEAFIQACRFLIRRMADEIANGDERVRDSYQKIQDEQKKAEQWRAANDSTAQTSAHAGTVRYASIEDYRP